MSFSHMDVLQEVYDLALLFDMRIQEGPNKHVNFNSMGNVHMWNGLGPNNRGVPIAFRNNTLNAKCNLGQLIRDIRYASLTRLRSMKVKVHQLPTCLLSCGLLLPRAVGLWPLAARLVLGPPASLIEFTSYSCNKLLMTFPLKGESGWHM